jgi:hypothetical protein
MEKNALADFLAGQGIQVPGAEPLPSQQAKEMGPTQPPQAEKEAQ